MKRLLSAVVAFSILMSVLSVVLIYPVSAEQDGTGGTATVSEIGTPPLRFERAAAAVQGYVDVRDGKFVIAGRNYSANNDYITYTKGLTGRNLTDFTIKYVYRTPSTGWNRNMLVIHTDSEAPVPTRAYVFSIQGAKETGASKPSAVIAKNATVVKTASQNGVITPNLNVAINTDYNVEVKVSGKTISAWVYKLGTAKPNSPTVTYTDSQNTYASGDIAFASRAVAFSVSNITLTDDVTSEVICSDYSPMLYNSDVFPDSAAMDIFTTSGMVNTVTDGYRVFSNSNYDSATHPVLTNALPAANGKEKEFENFEFGFDYKPNSATGTSKLLFNSGGPATGSYSLVLPGEQSSSPVTLNEGGSELASCAMSLTVGTVYRCEMIKTLTEIKIWIYEKSANRPENPSVYYTSTTLLDDGNIYFYTVNGDFTVNNIALKVTDKTAGGESAVIPADSILYNNSNAIIFEKSSTLGYLDVRDGVVAISGSKDTTSDAWVETKGITGKALTDFTVKYTYVSSKDRYGCDQLVMRTDSNGVKRSDSYTFAIQGKMNKIDNEAQSAATLWICKNQATALKTAPSAAKGVWLRDITVTPGVEYNVEVTARGNVISAWFYPVGSPKPAGPSLTYTDASNEHPSGDIGFACWSSGFSVSGLTVIDDVSNTAIVESYTPELYNAKALDIKTLSTAASQATGFVRTSGNKLRISSWSDVIAANSYTATNVLDYKDGKYIKNFDLCFVYSAAAIADNTGKIVFNSSISEYSLVLKRTSDRATVAIYKDSLCLTEQKVNLRAGLDYQIILSRADGKINVYVYRVGKAKPDSPTMSVTDLAPLPAGNIYFATDCGDFCVSNIALKVNDSESAATPIYELDFEDSTIGNGNMQSGTSELVSENGNTFLRLTKNDVGDGSLNFGFGPSTVKNFTINMHVRVRTLQNARWHYISLKYHTVSADSGDAYEAQIFPRGSDIAIVNKSLSYLNTNKKIGMSGPAGTTVNPNHDEAYGLSPDEEWHKISVVCDGYLYSLYIDGKLMVQATDTEQLYEKGGFRLCGWGADYDVDNIRIFTETYFNIEDDIVRTGPTGLIFSKTFENNDRNMDGLTLNTGDKVNTTVMSEDNGNSFLRVFGDKPNSINSNIILSFGPNNVRNFDLKAKIRVKAAFSDVWSYVAVGIHSMPSNLKWNTIWMNMAPKGSAVVLKNTLESLGTNNMVASTGLMKSTSQTAFMPNDNRDYGLRPDGKWHDINVVVREYTYTLFVDGVKYISYTDPSQTFEKGKTTLCGYGVSFDVDDIELTNYSEYKRKADALNTTVLDTAGRSDWLGVSNIGAAANAWSFTDKYVTLPEKSLTKEILAYNKAPASQLNEFEWEFEYRAASARWGRTAFLYHVDGKNDSNPAALETASALSAIKNVFGVCLTGSNVNAATGTENIVSNLKNNAFTVLWPNSETENKLTPLVYKTEMENRKDKNIPDAASYLSLDATDKLSAIDISKWITVKIRLISNKLTLTVWQNDNKSETLRTKQFTIPLEAMKLLTKGDFVISNGDCKTSVRNMSIMAAGTSIPDSITYVPATGDTQTPYAAIICAALSVTVTALSALLLIKSRKSRTDTGKRRR